MNRFSDLALVEPLQRALRDEGYTSPTPIQQQAIPPVLGGSDLLGCARTGTGKTAAFALPILQRLASDRRPPQRRGTRALVVVPTRELANQVAESFKTYGRHLAPTVAVVYGGVGQAPQVRALERGLDVLVATPGRLLDLLQQRHVRLDGVEVLVLDEADQMLDLGFLPDVKRILSAVPPRRQTLLFSATMPAPIQDLAQRILRSPVEVFVTPAASPAEGVEQHVRFVPRDEKPDALARLLADAGVRRALVFTRTKRGCDRVARRLVRDGIPAQAIHGDKSQGNRERTLQGFRTGRLRVLVATDIAARGIDIEDISHVVNYEIPNVPETYVHRIGRTARAGATGVAISLCSPEERAYLRDIERLIRRPLSGSGPSRMAESPSTHAPAPRGGRAIRGGGRERGRRSERPSGFGARERRGVRDSRRYAGAPPPAATRALASPGLRESDPKHDTFGAGL
jgi:ATP-dependent RNA helicase RhlE